MKISIFGGSGFIGTRLVAALMKEHHTVTIVTRNSKKVESKWGTSIRSVEWDPLYWGTLEKALDGQQVVINLAGEGIAEKRWSASQKEILRQSRIDITRSIVKAISNISSPPGLLINASGTGYYGIQPPEPVDESSEPGDGFLAELCVEWEREALKARDLGARVVCIRSGMVLGTGGGALPKMLLPFKMFVGGPIQPGTQPISWIHIDDWARLVIRVLNDPQAQGPINAVSPHPVTMNDFCRTLGKVLGRPSWLPVPAWVLQAGLGEMATLMTHGQTVTPTQALRLGVDYQYPKLEPALQAILGQAT